MIEIGEVVSIPFGNLPEVVFRDNGFTPEGRGKYLVDFSIPKGEPGTGSGNIKADVTGVIAGKTYLFQPSGDGSPEGILIEYTPEPFPEAPQDGKTYGRKDGGWYEVNSAGNMDGGTAFSIYGGSLVMDGGNSSIEI